MLYGDTISAGLDPRVVEALGVRDDFRELLLPLGPHFEYGHPGTGHAPAVEGNAPAGAPAAPQDDIALFRLYR